MSYIRMSDLQGMGEVTSAQLATEIAGLQQRLQGIQTNITNMEAQAAALRSSQPSVAAALDANVRALRSAETAINQQIAGKQQLAASLQAQEAANRQAMLNFAGQMTQTGAQVAGAMVQADAARRAAREEARAALRAQQGLPPLPSFQTGPAPAESGLSTGAMIGIGVVSAVVVIGGIAYAMSRQQPQPQQAPVMARNKGKKSKCGRCHCRPCTC